MEQTNQPTQAYTKQTLRRQILHISQLVIPQEFLETQHNIADQYRHCTEYKIFRSLWILTQAILNLYGLLVCFQAEATLSRLKGLPGAYRTCWQQIVPPGVKRCLSTQTPKPPMTFSQPVSCLQTSVNRAKLFLINPTVPRAMPGSGLCTRRDRPEHTSQDEEDHKKTSQRRCHSWSTVLNLWSWWRPTPCKELTAAVLPEKQKPCVLQNSY